jgi:hypothetical protein
LIGRQVTIGTFATRADAEVAQGLLASAGIAGSVSSYDAGGAYPFDFSGGAQPLVDEDDVEAASELLATRS